MDLLSEFSIKIYEPPLSEIRDSGRIRDVFDPVNVLMLLVDFQTEVEMNGIVNFLGNSTGLYASGTVRALVIAGRESDSRLLGNILRVAAQAGMTRDEIQKDLAGLPECTVASFRDLHGDKWNAACDAISEIEEDIDYDGVFMMLLCSLLPRPSISSNLFYQFKRLQLSA